MTMLTLKAKWILPVSGEPIRDGVVCVEHDRVVRVEQGRAGRDARDLGCVALLPGLVNAHTHLELSDIDTPLGCAGIPFVDWIGLVVARRRGEDYDEAEAIRRGLEECKAAGVAAIGDIVQPSSTAREPPILQRRFLELIGPTPNRAAEAIEKAEAYVRAGQGRGGLHPGLSPHAPYSVTAGLVEDACRLSREHHLPVALHLAESTEELQFLREGTGPFRDLLERLDSWDPSVHGLGRRPLDFLKLLAEADRALAIHGNYLDGEEIGFLAERREWMSTVYCPRTHAWFGHDPYPLEEMLAAGVNVALGTDSRASSPDLNLLEEMRAVAREHPAVSAERIVEMGTLSGARALGLDGELGTLDPGKLARFAVVDLAGAAADDPYGLLGR